MASWGFWGTPGEHCNNLSGLQFSAWKFLERFSKPLENQLELQRRPKNAREQICRALKLRDYWACLRAPGTHLGTIFGPVGAVFGASWSHLGLVGAMASLRPLGRTLEPACGT